LRNINVQELNETAEAIVLLSGGKPKPIRIRWRNTVYHVSQDLHHYSTEARHLHIFALQTKEDFFMEVSIAGDDLTCQIRRNS
jgi:hypothetical protein